MVATARVVLARLTRPLQLNARFHLAQKHVLGTPVMIFTASQMTHAKHWRHCSSVTAANVSAKVTRSSHLKIVQSSKRTIPSVSKHGGVTITVMTATTFVSAVGITATAVVPTKGTNIAKIVHAKILARTVMAHVRCIISEEMATVTTTTIIAVAVGTAATAVGTKIIMISVKIALVMTPTSKVIILACQDVKSTRGKVMDAAMIAITNAVAIGTGVTVASKQIKSWQRTLFITAVRVHAWMKLK